VDDTNYNFLKIVLNFLRDLWPPPKQNLKEMHLTSSF